MHTIKVDSKHQPATGRKLLTIIMPARNEEANLARAYDSVTAVMANLPYDYEVFVIDNDSLDGTGAVASQLCARDRRWRYCKLSRNFQVEGSLAAGLRLARGDAAIVLFSDLQDPPELIPQFVQKWEEGCDVVYGARIFGFNTVYHSYRYAVGNRLLTRVANILFNAYLSDLHTCLKLIPLAMFNSLRGLAHWIGYKQCAVPYERQARLGGQSKASCSLLLNLAANALTCFSIKPLQMFSLAGLAALFGTLLLALACLGSLVFSYPVPRLELVHWLLLANLSVLLLGFGMVGEYVGRIYFESKRRPLFLIDRTINVEEALPDTIPIMQPEGDSWDGGRPGGRMGA